MTATTLAVAAAASDAASIRTLVADEDPLARRAVREALEEGGVSVVSEASNGREAVEWALYHRPDVVVLELDLPGLDAAAVTRRILERLPAVHVIALSASADEEAALRMLRAGASGFLSKHASLDALPRALAGVMAGQAAISRTLSMRVLEELRVLPADGRGLRPVKSELTNREWEVVDLLASGASTHEISEELVLTLDTVYSHVKHIMRKLGVRSRAEIVEAAAVRR